MLENSFAKTCLYRKGKKTKKVIVLKTFADEHEQSHRVYCLSYGFFLKYLKDCYGKNDISTINTFLKNADIEDTWHLYIYARWYGKHAIVFEYQL